MKNSSEKINKLKKTLWPRLSCSWAAFEDKLLYANEMKSFFNNAFQQKNVDNKFQALMKRPELGSVTIDANPIIFRIFSDSTPDRDAKLGLTNS